MKVMRKILSLLLVGAMLFALAACKDPQDGTTGVPGTTNGSDPSANKATYTVKLTTAGGMALAGYQVLIYDDPSCSNSNIVEMGTTDSKGAVSWSLTKGKEYYIQLDDSALKGYDLKPYYTFNGTSANLTLTSSLIKGEDPASNVFEVGDVMYDFSFEDHSRMFCAACGALNDTSEKQITTLEDGTENVSYVNRMNCADCGAALDWENPKYQTITLSEVLAEKDLVMLNFWYTTCSNCEAEFPVLNKAYDQLAENIEVLGLNSYARDDVSGVNCYEANFGLELSFPLGKVDNNFNPQKFINPRTGAPSEGYPTSVFVDRYGVICLIEVGALTSLTEWTSILSHFVGDDYEQKVVKSADELITKPTPTVDNPPVEDIDAAFTGSDDLQVEYRWEADDIYSWPFLVGEKEGETCLYASNSQIYESYSILYADVTMEKGDVLAFDYWASSEKNYDVLYVIVDNEPIYTLSGLNEGWNTAYCWIADAPGTYELALCYQKDTDGDEGDDTVYLKNLRTVSIADIDSPSYLPRQAAQIQEDGSLSSVKLVLNEQDGYYHVGTADGPLLLAGLYDFTQFSEEEYIYLWAANGDILIDGKDSYADYVEYFSAATNSNLLGWCTVTEELAEYLKVVADIKGYLGDENEWLLFCKYFDAYGTNGKQLEDPVAGLKTWSALIAVEGEGVETNTFYYNGNPIMPRGKLARFTPTKSGVYRISSTTDYTDTLDAWIFDEDYNMLYQYANDEMLAHEYVDSRNVTMVMYMEAGVDYYIDIAPYDPYAICNVWYDITFLGETYDLFHHCSPGPFTTVDGNMGPDDEGVIIHGIDVILNPADGYYHEDLGKDAEGNQIYGSIVYAYFAGPTPLYSQSIVTMIEKGGFDFGMDEVDEQILYYWELNNYDNEATIEYINGLQQEISLEQILDVFEGKYHGGAGDLTEEMRGYMDKMINDSEHPELEGCVPVDARLAEILQMAMDKYTFKNVENSWQKFCFYYDLLGSRN